jgi:CBS domain-containing protein
MRNLSEIVSRTKPFTLPASATVREACCEMRDRRIGAVLVTNRSGRLLGIFTGRDAVGRVVAAGKSAAKTKLSSVMTADPVTMTPDMTAIDALRLMWDGGFRHIPIIEDDQLVGIVSRTDFQSEERGRLEEERNLWETIR